MLTAGKDLPSLSKADIDSEIRALLFSANGEYLVSGDGEWVRVWRIENGKQMARMEAELVNCLAVSKDGLWISAGTERGWVFVWNAKTYKLVFSHQENSDINGVDFSPLDSSRLVIASRNCTANVWDTTICQQVVGPLHHEGSVRAAKYSPQGGRIATATYESVRVYDSNDGRLLVDVPVQVTPWYHTALLWSSQQLFVVSKNQIKQLEASTGSIVSEWLVSDANCWSCISLQQHSEFITYSAHRSITFWDTSTHARLGHVRNAEDIHSITLSPDGRFLAIGGRLGRITVRKLSGIIVSTGFHWTKNRLNKSLVLIIFLTGYRHLVSSTPYISELGYSDRRSCA